MLLDSLVCSIGNRKLQLKPVDTICYSNNPGQKGSH